MPATVIVGAQWGDEGKGKVVDYCAERADVVVRFQGGNNAGHTVEVAGETFKFHLLPSGVVRDSIRNVLGNGLVIDPKVLLKELAELRAKGRDPRLTVSDRAHVILPHHRTLDGLAESAAKAGQAIGTTKRGIGPAYADKISRTGVRVGDLLDEKRLRARLEAALPERNLLIEHYGGTPVDLDATVAEYAAYGRELAPLVTDTVALLHDAYDAGDRLLLEGAQGTFLDIDHGTFPFVTSSNTTAGGACTGTGLPPTLIDHVIGIVKAYTTRVGEGPFVTELSPEDGAGKHLGEVGHEFGTTTGRKRRCGWLDLVLLRRSVKVNGISAIALTKLDVLGGLDKILVCDAYDVDGVTYQEPPADPDAFARARPIYREFEGFAPLSKAAVARAAEQGAKALPPAALAYVRAVRDALEVDIALIGLGPGREATVEVGPDGL